MILHIAALPATLRGPDDPAYGGRMPKRALFLAPDAAASLRAIESSTGGLVYTDIFRSAESSLAARRTKRGVQPPAYSAHNYGLAIDLDVGPSVKRLGASARYPDLLDAMAAHGWYCHRRDMDASASESWHFNYLGADAVRLLALADRENARTWERPIEARIVERYGADFHLDASAVQHLLADLRFYAGDVDGKIGPISREAVDAFQRAWGLPAAPWTDDRFQRTLAYVAADRRVEEAAPLIA